MTVVPFHTNDDVNDALTGAVHHLRAGGVLAHPTETVYGLGCRLEEHALQRLSALKQRGEGKPFVVLVNGTHMLDALRASVSPPAKELMAEFWPGPLTLVLGSARTDLPGAIQSESGVAVRWTSHPGLQRLIAALGEPMTSTSANVSTLPPARSAEEIAPWWPSEVASGEMMVLDGGTLGDQLPSTVVDCSTDVPRVLRAGAIPLEQLRATVPRLFGVK
ncbi:MAG TPA: L-threonylcarbamoyladenylate synthase [Gemmatimonadaceae bacterium]|nr:L-threonylcarbamoyladenylate synthase [Gemmatimonadaceae bacterium]